MDMSFSSNGPYADDHRLLAELGLQIWTAPLHKETFVGEVSPYPANEEPNGRTRIAVFVSCAPAQFYRFVIERRFDVDGYDGMERIEVLTGSGTLTRYWPMALEVANGCLVVRPAELLAVN